MFSSFLGGIIFFYLASFVIFCTSIFFYNKIKYLKYLSLSEYLLCSLLLVVYIIATLETSFGSTLFIALIGLILYIYFKTRTNIRESLKFNLKRFITYHLISSTYVIIFLYIIHLRDSDSFFSVIDDYVFYFNKAFTISETGVESIIMGVDPNARTLYHYIDIWMFRIFLNFEYYTIAFYLVLIPLLITIINLSVTDSAELVLNRKLNKLEIFICSFTVFIAPIPFLFSHSFDFLGLATLSPFGYFKLIIPQFLIANAIYLFISKNYQSLIFYSISISIGYINIAPSIMLFSALVFFVYLLTKKKQVSKYFYLNIILLGLFSVFYLNYLYEPLQDGKVKVNNSQFLDLKQYIIYFVFSLLYLGMYYVPYFLPTFFTKSEYKNKLFFLFLAPLGGILAATLFYQKFIDAAQFIYVFTPGFFAVLAMIFILIYKKSKILYGYIMIILVFNLYFSYIKFRYAKMDKQEYSLIKRFLSNSSYKDIAFLSDEKWLKSEYAFTPEVFAPDYLIYENIKFPFKMHWVDIYKGGMDESRFDYQLKLGIMNNTPFYDFNQSNLSNSLERNRVNYIVKNKIKLLITDKMSIDKEIKKIITDSLILEYNNIYKLNY
ncbi:MAG: hypothetical protein H6604_04875 [Flavobacteriales bacterium]|nr:hypothetical protein [Flavobacteriales bacterium]